eukprot:2226267-Rhodomonas_salina.2
MTTAACPQQPPLLSSTCKLHPALSPPAPSPTGRMVVVQIIPCDTHAAANHSMRRARSSKHIQIAAWRARAAAMARFSPSHTQNQHSFALTNVRDQTSSGCGRLTWWDTVLQLAAANRPPSLQPSGISFKTSIYPLQNNSYYTSSLLPLVHGCSSTPAAPKKP